MNPVNWILDHRPEALGREADAEPGEQRLRERRVEHALLPEPREQPVGGPEDAAVPADILAQDQHGGIVRHGARERRAHGLDERQLRHHGRSPAAGAASSASRSAASAAGRVANRCPNMLSGGCGGSAR